MPGFHAWNRHVWTRPGTMSRLPLRRGTQNEWMTSRLVPRISTFVFVGITIWPLVTIGAAGLLGMYPQIDPSAETGESYSHHHCWPVTLISHCVSDVLLSSKMVLIVKPPITARSTAGMAMNVYSMIGLP